VSTPSPRRRRPDRWYEDEPDRPRRPRRRPAEPEDDVPERPQLGDRWSTWDESSPAERGPEPYPGWLVTDPAAVDTELGVLKTGKEADVHLLERAVPGGAACLLAAKRYRGPEHRLFHRDEAYLE
jgi:RIO kinase 1